MVNVAFKRAKVTGYKGYFHDDYIVEYRPDPEDAYAKAGGWEILAEDDFNREMTKNPELHILYCEKKKQTDNALVKSAKSEEIVKFQLSKEERIELESLRKFKKSKTIPKR
jgi:hypothetical protein